MKIADMYFIAKFTKQNEYCKTDEEKALCRSSLAAAVNWGYEIDREQHAYKLKQKQKSIIHRA